MSHNEYTQQWNRKCVMSHNEKYNNAIENTNNIYWNT